MAREWAQGCGKAILSTSCEADDAASLQIESVKPDEIRYAQKQW